MTLKKVLNAGLTVLAAIALVIFVLNLAANPQLLDWVLPIILSVVAMLWLLNDLQQRHPHF
ncbi:MAG TPA: hypothetical protein VHO69_10195 [Phototrophicaceae bacterium]|nr:hypothetical protein [Phototrophicaceae bacterium]